MLLIGYVGIVIKGIGIQYGTCALKQVICVWKIATKLCKNINKDELPHSRQNKNNLEQRKTNIPKCKQNRQTLSTSVATYTGESKIELNPGRVPNQTSIHRENFKNYYWSEFFRGYYLKKKVSKRVVMDEWRTPEWRRGNNNSFLSNKSMKGT